MPRLGLALSASILLLFAASAAASVNPKIVVRDGKQLGCAVRFNNSLSGDSGTQSYAAVFTARVLTIKAIPVNRGREAASSERGLVTPKDLRLTVTPEEIFKGNLPHQVEIFAEQGECFAPVHAGDDWLIFAEKDSKSNGFRISYIYSNPSGPSQQKADYIERLRGLKRGDGLSYVIGEVGTPSLDLSRGEFLDPQPNHRVELQAEHGKGYAVKTNAEGKFELGPVAPAFFTINANTNPQFRAVWGEVLDAITKPNGCSWVRIDLETNSEISGRIILPDGYQYKKSEIGNFFPLFSVDIDTPDGKQVAGSSIGDGLKFTVWGLHPGTYILQLVNYSGESWIKSPVYAPGVTNRADALKIDLGLAEHKTGLEIRVPPEALKKAQ